MMKWHETIPPSPTTRTGTFAHLCTAVSKPPSLCLSLSPSVLLACFLFLKSGNTSGCWEFSFHLSWCGKSALFSQVDKKRRRNEGNERISRFLLRSEEGFFTMFFFSGKRHRRQPIVQFHAVKNSVPHLHLVSPQSDALWRLKEKCNHVWLSSTEQRTTVYCVYTVCCCWLAGMRLE